jgi:hypothetical protein
MNIKRTINELIKKYPSEKERIITGVNQVYKLWRKDDGNYDEFHNFCIKNFKTEKELDILFERFNENLTYIEGYLTALELNLRIYLDEDRGELTDIDRYFANLNLANHLDEDMFKTKLAFAVLLNFPIRSFNEIIKNMDRYTRKEWACIRLAQKFISRVPSNVLQNITNVYSKASEYVYSYNIDLSKVIGEDGKTVDNLKLISHWGLRDQIKIYYKNNRTDKQRTIFKVMENVVKGLVPDEFINDKEKHIYNPFTIEYNGKKVKETNSRYKNLLEIFKAHREEDKYYLMYQNYIERVFNLSREISFEDTERLLLDIIKNPVAKEIANIIERKLNRKLDPFDIWYNGFSDSSEAHNLDEVVKQNYPDIDTFQKSIKDILIKLDFDEKEAEYLSSKIEVDPARGAGHAWGPKIKGEKAHLRTKLLDARYLNWQSFNTAMHELGHCVEQVYTLYDMDYYTLTRVPNTAFTEAFAFVFQNKSQEILGLKKESKHDLLSPIQTFWDTREIAGVALVDMYIWRWMYKKQKFTETQLREKVNEIAIDIWNKYYYPILKVKDTPILGVYSHMIFHGLYLPDYPIGHIIAYKIEKYFRKNSIGKNMKRMCKLGKITPLKWLREAISEELEVKSLIDDVKKSVEELKIGV